MFFSCTRSEPDITGRWVIDNDFFKATYVLQMKEGRLTALVLDYYDGTTRISHNAQNKQYLFKNLERERGSFIDGISGATRKGIDWEFRITQMANDTLLVEQQISGKVLKELWVRSNKKYETF
ncbi:MAG: hypothetical protein HEP71_29145 [Roseivirga sp.]|nr:hypothetical protein [Roseivirga sp.]